MTDTYIAENILKVNERIKEAAINCGRDPEEVRLVAVAKTIPPEKVKTAINAGVKILGENYLQEAQKKIGIIGKEVAWHFIGHLQTNKAKFVVDLFDLVHSVENYRLAERLNREAGKKEKIMPILIQVNISGEDTKHGIDSQSLFKLIEDVSALPHLSIQGLMTMPPMSSEPEDSRPYFSLLRKLRDELQSKGLKSVSLKELSMGMSTDFVVAIEEGATLVRVGTSIFGARHQVY